MRYKEMIEEAKAKGLTSERIMLDSVDDLDDMLCEMKREHPEKYWKFMRKQHGLLYNNHYDEKFARWDVEQLRYTNQKGEKKSGEYWSVSQVEEATKTMSFPNGVTIWDKYVAANAAYSDWCRKFDDKQVLEAMYLFYFADEDWDNASTKIWDYFCCKHAKK